MPIRWPPPTPIRTRIGRIPHAPLSPEDGESMRIMKRFPGESMRIMKRFPGEEMRIMKRYPGEDMRIMRRMSPEFDRLRIMKRFPGETMRIMSKRDVSSAIEGEDSENSQPASSSLGSKGYYYPRPQGRSRS